jgi:hypothetical protein
MLLYGVSMPLYNVANRLLWFVMNDVITLSYNGNKQIAQCNDQSYNKFSHVLKYVLIKIKIKGITNETRGVYYIVYFGMGGGSLLTCKHLFPTDNN